MRSVGRYEILREIGRGGMAIVYAARQPDLDRQVALEELSSFHASSAESAHRFLRESRLAGSPSYMAPEQAMAGEIGPWTDLYSVGVLTYELILGSPPFSDSEAPVAILMRHVNERIPSAIELQPTLDPGLSQWIDSLLVKDAHRRVRHALDAWESLEDTVVRLLGPLWRRDARLLADQTDAVQADPLTPAPFESHVSISRPMPQRAELPDAFITFEPGGPRRIVEEPAETAPEPEPEAPKPEPEAPKPEPEAPKPEPEAPEPEPEEPQAEPEPDPPPQPEYQPAVPNPQATSPAPDPAPSIGPSGRRTSILVAGLVGVLAAVVGFVLAPASPSAPRTSLAESQTASTNLLSLTYPSSWRSVTASHLAVTSLGLSRPLTLVPRNGGDGAFIIATTVATDATLLPRGFAATLLSPPQALAHGIAATAAARLAPGPIGADGNAAIVTALRKLDAAYLSLALAAKRADQRQYTVASTAITQGDAALKDGFALLRQDGYSIG